MNYARRMILWTCYNKWTINKTNYITRYITVFVPFM